MSFQINPEANSVDEVTIRKSGEKIIVKNDGYKLCCTLKLSLVIDDEKISHKFHLSGGVPAGEKKEFEPNFSGSGIVVSLVGVNFINS